MTQFKSVASQVPSLVSDFESSLNSVVSSCRSGKASESQISALSDRGGFNSDLEILIYIFHFCVDNFQFLKTHTVCICICMFIEKLFETANMKIMALAGITDGSPISSAAEVKISSFFFSETFVLFCLNETLHFRALLRQLDCWFVLIYELCLQLRETVMVRKSRHWRRKPNRWSRRSTTVVLKFRIYREKKKNQWKQRQQQIWYGELLLYKLFFLFMFQCLIIFKTHQIRRRSIRHRYRTARRICWIVNDRVAKWASVRMAVVVCDSTANASRSKQTKDAASHQRLSIVY